MEWIDWLSANWGVVILIILIADKVVTLTPTKYDDLILTAIKGALGRLFPGKNVDPKPPPSGRIDFKVMAAVFAIGVLMVSVLGGCETFNSLYPAPEKKVCDQEQYQGVICDLFHKAGAEPEQYQDVILDATDIALILKPELGAKVKAFTADMRLKIDNEPWLWLVDYVGYAEQRAKILGIMQILSRRVEVLKVEVQLDGGSYNLIMAHFDVIDDEVDKVLGN